MANTITVGIAGVTGRFARLVVKALSKYPNVKFRGLCRNSSKISEIYHWLSEMAVVQGPADDMCALKCFAKGCDVVICCYHGDNKLMNEGQQLLIDACDEVGVPRYIASDYCIDFTKLEYGQFPDEDPLKHIKEHLDTKTHVKGVHVLTGMFMETFWSGYFGVWHPTEFKLLYYGEEDEVWEVTASETAAEYVAAVALDRNAVGLLYFLGDRKSTRQIADEMGEVYGDTPRIERLGSQEDLFKKMQARYKKNPSDRFAYFSLFHQYYCINGQTSLKKDLDNSKYPQVKPATLKDFLRAHKLEDLVDTYEKMGSV